ncbi:hypothetical protein HPP92_029022 [Vanilla planifolia]|uniref:Secreted protein n=1 Tax=Vanilla planifolia TaxID=51239 RepID=A0A835P701_VANPL|nr:hypothetical protein HPP92_029010 [Vanilla planifolia]KAG0446073.1 hypothetical protein HPP92_029022 [Vanilla planifolia]
MVFGFRKGFELVTVSAILWFAGLAQHVQRMPGLLSNGPIDTLVQIALRTRKETTITKFRMNRAPRLVGRKRSLERLTDAGKKTSDALTHSAV